MRRGGRCPKTSIAVRRPELTALLQRARLADLDTRLTDESLYTDPERKDEYAAAVDRRSIVILALFVISRQEQIGQVTQRTPDPQPGRNAATPCTSMLVMLGVSPRAIARTDSENFSVPASLVPIPPI